MNLQAIRDMTDRYEALVSEIRLWYVTDVHPLVIECNSIAELDAVWLQVSLACAGNDGTIREMPGLLSVEKVMSYDSLKRKLESDAKRLDNIIDEHARDREWYERLLDETGGCSCHLGHAPCSFCENYDWTKIPLTA